MGECLIIRASGGIDISNATSSESTILSGYTAYVNDEKVTGSMVNRGSVTSSLDPSGSYTVLDGYHDGTGKVSVSSLLSNTPGTAQNAWILSGHNAWVNGNKLTGSMANRGNQSWSLAANGTQIIWSGFYDGTGKVSQSLTTNSGGTWTPTTSNKTLVNTSTWVSGAWYVAGASTLVAANIKKDVTIFGVKGTWVGYVSGNMYLIQNGILQWGTFTISEGWDGPSSSWQNHIDAYGTSKPTTVNGALRIYSWTKASGDYFHYDRWNLEFKMPTWVSGKTFKLWYDYSVYVTSSWDGGNRMRASGGIRYDTVSSGRTDGAKLWSISKNVGSNGDNINGYTITTIDGSSNRWVTTEDAWFCFFTNNVDHNIFTVYGYIDIRNLWITLE